MYNLLDSLALERVERDMFLGFTPKEGTGPRIFGGQVIAQCLLAAYETVEGRACHSLHAYFIHPGDPNIPILLEVDRARDGGSFTTRRVTAVQQGRQILNFAASFQVVADGFDHQAPAPILATPPDDLPADDHRGEHVGLQMRTVDLPRIGTEPLVRPPVQRSWFRATQPVPDELRYHQAILAFASDYPMMGTAMAPHNVSWDMPGMQNASLDHAIWFHRPFDVTQWHLHDMDSPSASGTRGFNRGSIFGVDGTLVASTAQEAMVRVRKV